MADLTACFFVNTNPGNCFDRVEAVEIERVEEK